jgi:hypothetical protein
MQQVFFGNGRGEDVVESQNVSCNAQDRKPWHGLKRENTHEPIVPTRLEAT